MTPMRQILAGTLLVALGACAARDLTRSAAESIADGQRDATGYLKQIRSGDGKVGTVSFNEGAWLGSKPIELAQDSVLPAMFQREIAITRSVTSLGEIAERITQNSGVPVKISRDALAMGTSMQTRSAAAPGASVAASVPATSPSAANATGIQNAFQINYAGTLSGLLDMITARYGVSWRYRDGAVEIFHLDTRTFVIHAIPGDSSLSANVGSSSQSSQTGSTGGSAGTAAAASAPSNGQVTSVTSSLSVWTGLQSAIKGMLSAVGTVVASPSTGSITVTDTPEVLARVESFVKKENRALARQVMVTVKVLSVSTIDGAQFGINWDAVYTSLSKKYGINLTNTFNASTDASQLKVSVLDTATGGASQWAGSDAVISALQSVSKVSLMTSASVYTLNNQPVPVQVAKQTSYLASVMNTLTPNVGSTTALTPGIVTSGFNMNLLPHILEDNTVLLQYAVDISSLLALRSATSNGSTIQIPELETRNFLQRVSLRSGETLVLSGFEQSNDTMDRHGALAADNPMLGGGRNTSRTHDQIVVLITPVLTERSK